MSDRLEQFADSLAEISKLDLVEDKAKEVSDYESLLISLLDEFHEEEEPSFEGKYVETDSFSPSQEKVKILLDSLPSKLDLVGMTDDLAKNLLTIIDTGCGQKITEHLPDKINPHTLNVNGERLCQHLLATEHDQEIIERLDFSQDTLNFDRFITKPAHEKQLLAKIPPGSLNLETLNFNERFILEKFVSEDLGEEVIEKIPETINFKQNSEEASYFLRSLAVQGYTKDLLERFPKQLDLDELSRADASFLKFIINKGYDDYILSLLSQDFDSSAISSAGGGVLSALVDANHDELKEFIPDRLELSFLSEGMSQFLQTFLDRRTGLNEILQALPRQINLSRLSLGGVELLTSLLAIGQTQAVIQLMPSSYRLNQVNEAGARLLYHLIEVGYDQLIIEQILAEDDWSHFSKNLAELIERLYQQAEDPRLKELLLDQVFKSLRQPIPGNEIKVADEPVGPTLKEIIEEFPVLPGTLESWRGGWYRCSLKKSGSTTEMFIKFNRDSLPQVVFHNDGISPASLLTYQEVAQLIPDFVSSPIYRELLTEKQSRSSASTVMRLEGFREVYAGPDLKSLNLKKMPPELAASIESQVNFIRTVLSLHEIDHGHIHDKNINVRFLLESDERKHLCFDPNRAIKLAKENNWGITPIVILRDWDQASS